MADISKCYGTDCELKGNCYRYLAIAGMSQSYITPGVRGKGCEIFWDVRENTKKEDEE